MAANLSDLCGFQKLMQAASISQGQMECIQLDGIEIKPGSPSSNLIEFTPGTNHAWKTAIAGPISGEVIVTLKVAEGGADLNYGQIAGALIRVLHQAGVRIP